MGIDLTTELTALRDRLLSAEAEHADLISRVRERHRASARNLVHYVALRGTVPSYSDEGRLWERLMPALQQQGIRPVGPCGVIEHDDEYREADVDLSVYCPVAPGTRAEGPLVVLQLPERDCLVAHVIGPYTQISQAHDLIVQRMEAEGLAARQDGSLASKVFNRYLVTPDQAAPEDLVTEVCRPLA